MLVPFKVMVPEVLVTELVEPAILIPMLAAAPEAVPVKEIGPLPVVVETNPVPLMLIP